MFTNLLRKNNRANCASTSTTVQIAEVVPNDTTNTSIDFIDASCLFSMKKGYKQMVQKVFSSMIRRLFIEGIPADSDEFYKLRNANSYAAVAGKPLDTRKLMHVSGYFGHDPKLLELGFWQEIVSKDWQNDCDFSDFKVVITHWSHKSGDTGVYDCTISYHHASIAISTRTNWDIEFMQRLVRLGGLLILSKFNRSEEFVEAYATRGAGYRFTFTGSEYRNFGAMKSSSSAAMKTSAHQYIFNNIPHASIITRKKADFSWKLPYGCSVKETNHQYFRIQLNPDTAAINSYHRGPDIY